MDGTINYLNSDLELTSADDLTTLAAALEAAGLVALHVTLREDGLWNTWLETRERYTEPEPNIAAMVDVVESLAAPLRSIWERCSHREFNIGYDCGMEPWAFNQGLSSALLGRMAAMGVSLRITLYPDREEETLLEETE